MRLIYFYNSYSLAVVEPASNLQILEVASKSLQLTWDASIGEVSGYKVQMIPMMAGSKRQELYVGPTKTQVVVRDLSPDTEYQISLFALNGLMPSEPLTLMQKTQLVKVSLGEYEIVEVQSPNWPFIAFSDTMEVCP